LSPDGDATILSLEEWQEETGQDEHSYVSAPEDIFISESDFHLKEGCIAINHGTDLYAPATDIEGAIRPWDGAYDIGAYEFGAPVGIFQMSMDEQVILWPNPAKDYVTISSSAPLMKVEIHDLKGRILFSLDIEGLHEIYIPFSGMKAGLYIMRIYNHNDIIQKKIAIY
jgi:hypothetical protein